MIKISIITINFNNAAGLGKTLQSIKSLKCPDGIELESIVVDGASLDNSVDIIKSYSDTVVRYVSELDNGIYDAMNKGIKMASGDWLNFMNSGDRFFSDDVLCMLIQDGLFFDETIDVILGGNIKQDILQPQWPLSIAKQGIIPGCHQSMFFKNKGYMYNTSYRIYSDFDYFLEYYLKDYNAIKQIDFVISESEPDGIGAQISTTKRKDKIMIMIKRFGFLHTFNMYLEKMARYFFE